MLENNPDVGGRADISVLDLLSHLVGLCDAIEAGDPETTDLVEGIEIVPPSKSLAFKATLKKARMPLKAKIWPPDHSYRG